MSLTGQCPIFTAETGHSGSAGDGCTKLRLTGISLETPSVAVGQAVPDDALASWRPIAEIYMRLLSSRDIRGHPFVDQLAVFYRPVTSEAQFRNLPGTRYAQDVLYKLCRQAQSDLQIFYLLKAICSTSRFSNRDSTGSGNCANALTEGTPSSSRTSSSGGSQTSSL